MSRPNYLPLLCGVLLGLTGALPGPTLADPDLPDWRVLEYQQQAFLVTAQSRVELTPCSEQPNQWQLTASSSVASNSEQVELTLAAEDGRALQRSRLSAGKNQRYKTWVFAADSIRRERHNPPADADRPPGDWPVSSSREIPYPPLAANSVVTDAYALLALADRFLDSTEAAAEVIVNTDFNFYRVQMSRSDGPTVGVDYVLAGAPSRVVGERETRGVTLQVSPIGAQPDKPDFSLLGLSGEITILFDRASGLPVQLRGTAPRIGSAMINLKGVTLREPAA